jgi:hypothetical protein
MNVSLVDTHLVSHTYRFESRVVCGLSQRLLASVLLTLVHNGSYVTDESKSIEDYLADEEGNKAQLSYGLLKTVYLGTCLSRADEEDEDGNHQTNEMSQALYDDAAKCKLSHGMTSGFYDNEGYKNQVNQEAVVCNFIKSVSSSSSGDIIYLLKQQEGRSQFFHKYRTSVCPFILPCHWNYRPCSLCGHASQHTHQGRYRTLHLAWLDIANSK